MNIVGDIGRGALRGIRSMQAVAVREKLRLLEEVGEVRGLLPLLMKQRNHQQWTRGDKRLLRRHLRRVSRLSTYLVLLVLPGGLLALPALAWWLGRRRTNRG